MAQVHGLGARASARGAIALVDAGWLVTLAEDNGVLPPRQAAPPEAFLSLEEVRMMTPMGHCAGYERINLRIICVSHTWLQPEHPDPFGYNLRRLGRALKLLLESPHHCGRWGVFIDWISLYQACRAPDGTPQSRTVLSDGSCGRRLPSEDVLFRQALRSLGLFYSHMATHVFKLTSFPVGSRPAVRAAAGRQPRRLRRTRVVLLRVVVGVHREQMPRFGHRPARHARR